MSFRELRSFTEICRALGYPHPVSVEDCRTPNFPLVASVLGWLAKRYDPSIDVPVDVETEAARVHYIRNVVQQVAMKARVKLNPRRLYGADGYAVRELLKLASVLYDAMNAPQVEEDVDLGAAEFVLPAKTHDMRLARTLASELVKRGAQLYDLLEQEKEGREERAKATQRSVADEMDYIERRLQEAIAGVTERTRNVEEMMGNIDADEASLRGKIERKRGELERARVRLKSLQSVRPQYMDEYEKLEIALQKIYADYLERFRNVAYLENELEKYNKVERDRMEAADKALAAIQEKIREEEQQIIRGQNLVSMEDDFTDAALDVLISGREGVATPKVMTRRSEPKRAVESANHLQRPRAATGVRAESRRGGRRSDDSSTRAAISRGSESRAAARRATPSPTDDGEDGFSIGLSDESDDIFGSGGVEVDLDDFDEDGGF